MIPVSFPPHAKATTPINPLGATATAHSPSNFAPLLTDPLALGGGGSWADEVEDTIGKLSPSMSA